MKVNNREPLFGAVPDLSLIPPRPGYTIVIIRTDKDLVHFKYVPIGKE